MKPLFLVHSNDREPYSILARKLGDSIKRFYAGDFQLVKVRPPGEDLDFFTVSACLLYSYIIKAINLRPVIALDCDNELVKPLSNFFESDWDIAACYRGKRKNENGRQDYNGGMVALNNKRPDVIRRFWIEWIDKSELWENPDHRFWPKTLWLDGWRPSWYNKQSALNLIMLPDDRDYKIAIGQPYVSHGYKILPLDPILYGAKPGKETEETFMRHYVGGEKRDE